MDKTKTYKIINTLTAIGEIADAAKHKIGRTGRFIRLTKGMRFEFLCDDPAYSIRSSSVEKIEELGDIIKFYTLNTIYIFELQGE